MWYGKHQSNQVVLDDVLTRAGWAVAARTSPAEPGVLHVARVPPAASATGAGGPWPWRRVEREGSEPFSELAEDVLGRLSYKVLQVKLSCTLRSVTLRSPSGHTAALTFLHTVRPTHCCQENLAVVGKHANLHPGQSYAEPDPAVRCYDEGRVTCEHAHCPQVQPTVGPELPFEAVIVRCGAMEGPQPTIVMPHGGPHRCVALVPPPP